MGNITFVRTLIFTRVVMMEEPMSNYSIDLSILITGGGFSKDVSDPFEKVNQVHNTRSQLGKEVFMMAS